MRCIPDVSYYLWRNKIALTIMNQEMNQNAPVQQPKRNNTLIFVTIIILLAGINIYLFINRNKVVEEKQEISVARDSAIQSRDAIQTAYDAALARLDDLTTKNAQMDKEITDKDGEIARLKNEISKILSNSNATKAELAKAKSLIATLNAKTKNYEERIAQLEGENKGLSDANASLQEERDATASQNMALKKLGAVLHASNIRMEPIDLRRNNTKENETTKAKRVDLLRIKFDIDENRIAESGTKDLYLCITGPDGNLLSNAAYGSGITTTSDGTALHYTLQKQISLTKGEAVKDLAIDWNQDSNYSKGNYTIEIYNEGYKIGSGFIVLR
jgi:uncharacterized protein